MTKVKDLWYEMVGTLPSGKTYVARVELTPDVARKMDEIAMAHPFRYTPNTWHNLYCYAYDLLHAAP